MRPSTNPGVAEAPAPASGLHRHVRGLPELARCAVMGVVNVTPDSFSDGGRFLDHGRAVQRGMELIAAGADLIDVGGESTRPGAARVPEEEELRRVLPVVRELSGAGAVVSVDTMRAGVAAAALHAGARMVNDISGGLADPAMAGLIADAGVAYVVMHWRGHGCSVLDDRAVYADVVAEVVAELRERLDAVYAAGVEPDQVVVDPGLGFAKTWEHNWSLLARLDALAVFGRPVLVAASRKRFLGRLLAEPDGIPRPFAELDAASAAITALAAGDGAWAVRVHEVRASVDAVRVAAALRGAR